jgi:hypothetical protein
MVQGEEDMVTAVCYIAERRTFGSGMDLNGMDIGYERHRVVDYFVHLLVSLGAY